MAVKSKLIVGLGNPGKEFVKNKHSIGFYFTNKLVNYYRLSSLYNKRKTIFWKKKTEKYGKTINLIILQPQTFMSLSGEAVLYIAAFLRIEVQDIIVICDDIGEKIGNYKTYLAEKQENHNGINSLLESLKRGGFTILKLGIGELPRNTNEEDFLLTNFSKKEIQEFDNFFPTITDICDEFLFSND